MKKLSLNKGEKIIKYALRKYSFGVVSVAVSVCFFTEIASASILINENTSIQETYSTNEDLSENITQKEDYVSDELDKNFVEEETSITESIIQDEVIDEKEDEALVEDLLSDEKELSEHNMLVDLGRNDLGRISEFGSVEVTKYKMIHKYSKIMHICSQVEGNIRKDKDALDAIASVLPAGTLSGAPKIRACEIIDELEKEPRGMYGGALGYIDFSGNLDTCIAIRMAVKKNGKVYVQAGGGIVADSKPRMEYEESANKAKAVMLAIENAKEALKP